MIKTKTFTLTLFCFLAIFSYAQPTAAYQLFFETDSFTIPANEQLKFSNFIRSFDTVTISQVSVLGYCDDVGDITHNEALSEKRAAYVSHLFPIQPASITVEGKGELPLEKGNTPEKQRANHRRVDITISYALKEKIKIPEVVLKTVEKTVEKKNSPLSDNQKVGDKITLDDILFIGGRHVLLPESYATLDNLTISLLEKTQYHILILGHVCCMEKGHDGVDYDTGINNLSVARAQTIYNYLIAKGVNKQRVSFKGMKADFPTGKGARQDRRVEIEITKIVSEQ